MKKSAQPAPITIDEWQAEIDALRAKARARELPPEVLSLIIHARTPDKHGRIVPLNALSDFIERKFGLSIPPTSIRDYYQREIRNGKSK